MFAITEEDLARNNLERFREGVKAGLTAFAWWKDGVQYVGTCGTTLRQALADVDNGKFDVNI